MEADIGGRRTLTGATILTPPHTAERTGEQLTTTRRREPMAGHRLPTVRTDRRREEPRTTRIPAPPREALRCRHLTAAEVRHRSITRTLEPMHRPDKVRVRQRSGAAPMCRTETRAPTRNITRQQTERLRRPKDRRVAKQWARVQHGETPRPRKLPAATCMPDTMAMLTRTPVTVGRSTIMEAGIWWTSLRLRPIGAALRTRSSDPAPEALTLIERARAVTIEAAKKQAAQVVAAATIVLVEARLPKCKICKEKRRTGSGVDKRASASKTFNAAAVIASVVAEEDGPVAAAAAGSEVDDDN